MKRPVERCYGVCSNIVVQSPSSIKICDSIEGVSSETENGGIGHVYVLHVFFISIVYFLCTCNFIFFVTFFSCFVLYQYEIGYSSMLIHIK